MPKDINTLKTQNKAYYYFVFLFLIGDRVKIHF